MLPMDKKITCRRNGLLGEAYAVIENLALARENYTKAIELNPINKYFQIELENLKKN